MVTTSSSKKKVKKDVHNGKHGDFWRSERFDVIVQVSGGGKTTTGRRPKMSEDDDAMTDEGDDGDDDMHQGCGSQRCRRHCCATSSYQAGALWRSEAVFHRAFGHELGTAASLMTQLESI
jgi:hypothetical protein